jgi:hypothetical protein
VTGEQIDSGHHMAEETRMRSPPRYAVFCGGDAWR